MAHDIPKPPRLDMPEADWRALTKPGAQAIAAMQKQITTLTGRVNSNPSSSPLDFSGKDGGISAASVVMCNRFYQGVRLHRTSIDMECIGEAWCGRAFY